MKRIIIILILLIFTRVTFSQQKQSLHVGDQMPAYKFPNLINSPNKVLDLKSLKGKVVILDFWFSGCNSCISLMPHMNELQQHFGNKIQIILVNVLKSDNIAKIDSILKRIKVNTGQAINLPVAVYDLLIGKYFPAHAFPHEVIIGPTGKIIAITSSDQINKEKIQNLIDGKRVEFSLKDDFWNPNIPIVANLNTNTNDGILTYSALIKWTPNASGSRPKYDENNRMVGVRSGFHIIEAYQQAYLDVFKDDPVVLFDGIDSLESINQSYTYDYIDQTGEFSESKWKTCLQQELDKAFNYSLSKTKKQLRCLVIKSNQNISGSYTKHDLWQGNLELTKNANQNHLKIYGQWMDIYSVISNLNSARFFDVSKIIDESSEKHKLDIEFPLGFDFKNAEKLKTYLSSKGIDLSIENRPVDVVTISNKKPGEPTIKN